MNGLELSKKIAGYLDNKKAKDVKIIKIDDLTVVTGIGGAKTATKQTICTKKQKGDFYGIHNTTDACTH